jgi:hypothetical protein
MLLRSAYMRDHISQTMLNMSGCSRRVLHAFTLQRVTVITAVHCSLHLVHPGSHCTVNGLSYLTLAECDAQYKLYVMYVYDLQAMQLRWTCLTS